MFRCEIAYVIAKPFSSMPLFATIAFSLIGGKRNLMKSQPKRHCLAVLLPSEK